MVRRPILDVLVLLWRLEIGGVCSGSINQSVFLNGKEECEEGVN